MSQQIKRIEQIVDSYGELAKAFYALSHPVRLRILQILAREEHCVCHLTAVLRKRQPYMSQQLAVLRGSGLVADRRDGLMVYYRVESPRVVELIAAMAEIMRAQGQEIELPPIAEGPLPGCPCPKCCATRERAN